MVIVDAQIHVWSADTPARPYRDAIRLFTEGLEFLGAEDREWIMGRAAAEWLRWPL